MSGLKWSEVRDPGFSCSYTHTVAETPLGDVRIEWKGWKKWPHRVFDVTYPWDVYAPLGASNVDDARAEVQEVWDEMAAGVAKLASTPTVVGSEA